MNELRNNIQNTVNGASQENMNLMEESEMKNTNHTSKWNNIKTPVKMLAGLAVGAMLMTAVAMPSNASADVPSRPVTSELQLIIQAEIDDGEYVPGVLTPAQQLMVKAEIDDGAYLPGFFSAEQQLVIQAEIDDGFALEIRAKETTGTPSAAEQQVLFQAEMEDGLVGNVEYRGEQVDSTRSGEARGVFQALLSDDMGSGFSAEQLLIIQAEIEDSSV